MSNDKWKMFRLLRKVVDVKADEVRALFLGFIYYFLIFSSYYVIRPIRDDISAANGIEKLPWLFTGTLVAMLIANALFAAVVVKSSRRRFIPIVHRFLIANLLLFFVLLMAISKEHQVAGPRPQTRRRR
jgi:AAA family ATP:ADP antiporter